MNTPCINHTKLAADGYGIIWNNKRRNWDLAHRRIWQEHNGPIPQGLMIRHLCHNRSCVNIDHLALGTMKDNRQDDIDAGKDWFRGEKNNMCIHSDAIIEEIRNLKPQGKPPYGYVRDLAKKYSMAKSTIHRIWKGNYRSKK